jgi:hypothetical protein
MLTAEGLVRGAGDICLALMVLGCAGVVRAVVATDRPLGLLIAFCFA